MGRTYLTIDDAPTRTLSEKVDILKELSIPAVFFCEGRRLKEYPCEARYAIESGYHLGNHTYSHPYASNISPNEFEQEITRTESIIDSIYTKVPSKRPDQIFRFPYSDKGETDATTFQKILRKHGFTPPCRKDIMYDWYADYSGDDIDWYWTVDVKDWEVDSKQGIDEQLEAAGSELDSSSSDIVLFHDYHNSPSLFRYFLNQLRDRGVQFASPLDLV